MRHLTTNQLYTQMEDLTKTLNEFTTCLTLTTHDRDQFIKEYGTEMWEKLIRVKRDMVNLQIDITENNYLIF